MHVCMSSCMAIHGGWLATPSTPLDQSLQILLCRIVPVTFSNAEELTIYKRGLCLIRNTFLDQVHGWDSICVCGRGIAYISVLSVT